MSACEKCWRDAGGDPDTYSRLLREREDEICTAEEQAGPDAKQCSSCRRMTLHQITGEAMCGCARASGRTGKANKPMSKTAEEVAKELLASLADVAGLHSRHGEHPMAITTEEARVRELESRLRAQDRESLERERMRWQEIVNTEEEPDGDAPDEVAKDFRDPKRAVMHLRAAVRATKSSILRRALASGASK